MKIICLGLLLTLTGVPGFCDGKPAPGPAYQQSDVANLFKDLISTYQVEIHADIDGKYFPDKWLADPVKASAVKINWNELQRFPEILRNAFGRYSKEVIYGNINTVFLASDIRFYGVSYGATNDTNSVYLVSNGKTNGFTDAYLEAAFHREFNTVLLRKFKFPSETWSKINPAGFFYKDQTDHPGVAALKDGSAWTLPNHKTYQDGFLDEYSKSALVKDVNVYTGMILTDPQAFNRLRKLFPKINEKFKIWLDYYHGIDPKFTEDDLFKH
jgi:hypothetical protein